MKTNALMVFASIQETEAIKEKVVKIDQQRMWAAAYFGVYWILFWTV